MKQNFVHSASGDGCSESQLFQSAHCCLQCQAGKMPALIAESGEKEGRAKKSWYLMTKQ